MKRDTNEKKVVWKKFTGKRDPFQFVTDGQLDEVVRMIDRDGENVNQTRWSGMSMLHRAAQLGYTDICQVLVERGADIDMRTTRGWYTPLHFALGHGYIDTAEYLIQVGAKLWTKCKYGEDAFDYGTRQGYAAICKDLRSKLVKQEMQGALERHKMVLGGRFFGVGGAGESAGKKDIGADDGGSITAKQNEQENQQQHRETIPARKSETPPKAKREKVVLFKEHSQV
mmetsp:Transcript_3432/g.5346  ORF Transcript_3432/g.5346 Transcript_3432/m.5346 type:complete len:227 (+) Transcript_3432:35-715(+)